MIFTIYCDAGSKGNPGYGYGSYEVTNEVPKPILSRYRTPLGPYITSNVAEYMILIKALTELSVEIITKVEFANIELRVFSDSNLMVQQLNGKWKCRASHIEDQRKRAMRLLNLYENRQIAWVPRAEMVKRFGH